MNILLRTLTRKSKFNLGKNKELTVQRIIDLNKKIDLISAYYKLSKFNYTKDILDELGIVDEWVILKPSKNEDLYYKFLKHINYNYRSNIISGADKMKKPLKTCFSKGYLQNINQKK